MDNQGTRNQHEAMLLDMIEKDTKAKDLTNLLDSYNLNTEVECQTAYLNRYPKTQGPVSNFRSCYDSIVYVDVCPADPPLVDVGPVDPLPKRFTVHKDLLCRHSGFFKACFQSGMIESVEDKVVLEDEDPATFSRFVMWLYTGTILEHKETIDQLPYREIMEIYLLSDRRQVPLLQTHVMNIAFWKYQKTDEIPDAATVSHVWNSTVETSLLRALIVDMYVQHKDSTSFLTADQDLDPDFLTTARLAFSEKKEETGTRTEEQKAGFWHERYRRYVKRGSLSS